MSNCLAVSLQYLLPKHAITTLAGKFASAKAGSLTTAVIRWFVGRYKVNMEEAAQPDISDYQSFNDFFTRALRPDARTISKSEFICPVDGAISQFGEIRSDQIFQAKGHSYSTNALLAGEKAFAAKFNDGSFATLYLSPKDYHRIHMPCDGRLISMKYVPGTLFSVNPATAQDVPGLFARNERVVCEFESKVHGTFVMVLVGATIVGSMATVWHGVVNPPRSKHVREWTYSDQNIELRQGEEMGRFLLGSTVVLLFPKNTLQFNQEWTPTKSIRLGEALGMTI
ncbi:MAG TPA: archaetidylserine decarboxylase [Methylophilaceae bacterium]|nr:archaetidylserine decarboxylase [Methylophilaceae bacterium]